jgi:hypothetical protein
MILTIKQFWRSEIQAVLESLGHEAPALASIQIEARKGAKRGEYSSAIALKAAVHLNMAPSDLAKQFQSKLQGTTVSRNAFLNFSCGPERLWPWFLGLKSQGLNLDCSEQKTLRYYRKRLYLLALPSLVKEVKFEDFLLLNDLDYQLGLAFADFLDDYYYLKKPDRAWAVFFKVLQAYFNQMVFLSEDSQINGARGALINKIRLILE